MSSASVIWPSGRNGAQLLELGKVSFVKYQLRRVTCRNGAQLLELGKGCCLPHRSALDQGVAMEPSF